MTQKGTSNINDYVDDYEQAWQDYQNMGPLWADMVFGDDFEALKAIYGERGNQETSKRNQPNRDQNNRSSKRR